MREENTEEAGDNYPNFNTIHLKLLIHRERREMIERLINADEPQICQNDVIDWQIDCEIYNIECKRGMIKVPIKKRKKNDKK